LPIDKALGVPHLHGPNTVVRSVKLPLSTPRRHVEGAGAAPLVLNLGGRWRRVAYFTIRLFYSWKRTPGTHWRCMGESRTGRYWRIRKAVVFIGVRTPDRTAHR
jgi:hypothetical protein